MSSFSPSLGHQWRRGQIIIKEKSIVKGKSVPIASYEHHILARLEIPHFDGDYTYDRYTSERNDLSWLTNAITNLDIDGGWTSDLNGDGLWYFTRFPLVQISGQLVNREVWLQVSDPNKKNGVLFLSPEHHIYNSIYSFYQQLFNACVTTRSTLVLGTLRSCLMDEY